MRRWVLPSLMLITDRSRLRDRPLEEVASLAVEGGVTAVQLREKDLSGGELYDLAVTVHAVLRGRALLLVNDRVDVAVAAGADGVHLPEHTLPLRKLRDYVGDSCIVGRSVHSVEAALRAEQEGADYLLVGAVYETASHPGQPPAGPALVRAVAEAVRVPVLAVGGITPERGAEVIEAGADGVAVISAILDADDPKAAARALREALARAYGA
jgi:thiamine-phosphate pyrophosphorylase